MPGLGGPPKSGPPDLDSSGPLTFHYMANQQATGGDYGLYRVDIASNGGGAIPHFHRTISEAFFVLSGTLKLYDGSDWIDGHPNDFLYVPPGGIHAFRNEADEPTSFLILFAPGAPREAYFEGLRATGRPLRRGARRVVHQERQLLPGVTRNSRHAETCAVVIRCARLLSDQ